jgi:beta-barrel assembly-enhancing protease
VGEISEVPRRRGFGCGVRVLLALAIVGFALFKYFSQTEVNPVTGEKQHIAMTSEQETALGLEAAPEMAAQMGGEADPSDPKTRLVESVGRKVVQNSDASRSPYSYDFHLLRDPDTLNAFALPGGQVFITYGLLSKLHDEAQLAGVLGHEIGHVVNRHAAEHMATGQLGQLLTMAAGVAATDEEGRGQRAAMVAAMINQMVQLKYSRSDELEADRVGMDYMTQAGYDPSAMLGVMRVLAEASRGGRTPELLSTHPYPEQRLEAIQRYLAARK